MGSDSSQQRYDESSDPCQTFMKAYLKCVDDHEKGLSEGDECSKEGADYRACRKQQKLSRPTDSSGSAPKEN